MSDRRIKSLQIAVDAASQSNLYLTMQRIVTKWSGETRPPGLTEYIIFKSWQVARDFPPDVQGEIGLSYGDPDNQHVWELQLKFYNDRLEIGCVDELTQQPIRDDRFLLAFLCATVEGLAKE